MAAAAVVQALQTVISRSVNPLRAAVVSITQVHAGSAYNVLPESARLAGTIRTFEPEVRALVAERIHAIVAGVARGLGVRAEVKIVPRFQALRNTPGLVEPVVEAAREVVGHDLVSVDAEPKLGSEDFADFLDLVPGVYLWLGQGSSATLHNPRYVFNDELIPIGASLLARIAEARTAALAARRTE